MMNECIAVNILDILQAIGEEKLQRLLSDFSSPLNSEVEDFIRNKSIEFAKKKLSITYLVIRKTDNRERILVGIFTLAHKALEVTNSNISNTARRKLSRYAKLDEETDRYNVSAFLIAQFGKNSAILEEWEISGNELMDLTFEILKHVQHYVGGGVVYLDCENIDKVLGFYESDYNRFKRFGERNAESEGKKYLQLLRFF
ncbi:MAG: GNAT family acetyltransferase [Bacteroidales bacterium]|nr:GNAT family acetyltransferase [Bacteroidales bacterium]MCM1424369.1 GNAT family acetyltransferase [bacterium]